MTPAIDVPDHVQPYVDVLGLDLAIAFLLEFGGAPLYLPTTRTTSDGNLAKLVGPEKAVALGKSIGRGLVKVPLAKPFIASYYLAKDMKVVEIARLLHVDVATVQRWLPHRPSAQLALF